MRYYVVCDKALHIFSHFVELDNECLAQLFIKHGVPQGSILGPSF